MPKTTEDRGVALAAQAAIYAVMGQLSRKDLEDVCYWAIMAQSIGLVLPLGEAVGQILEQQMALLLGDQAQTAIPRIYAIHERMDAAKEKAIAQAEGRN